MHTGLRKTIGAIFVIAVITALLSGCWSERDTTATSDRVKDAAKITLTPVELFQGDEAKYKPFLGSMSGAFNLRYDGSKPNVALDIDIWQDGKKASGVGSVGDLFFSSDQQNHGGEVEVILTVETVSGTEGQDDYDRVKVGVFHDSGSSVGTFTVPHDKKLTGRGLMAGPLTRTFALADLPVPVWGMQATSTNQMRTADLSEESLSRLEWGLIFTLRSEE